jgi:uncharacterized spore protein YtfJ
MDAMDVLAQARDNLNVRTVFGEPITAEGVTIVPVARVRGGGGGGGGTGPENEYGKEPAGSGLGFGLVASPVGVYVIKDGNAHWRPSLDVTRIILGGQIVGVIALLVARSIAKRRPRR